MIIHSYCISQ